MALITKFHEKHILKNSDDNRCRMCKKDPESIFHLLGACDVLAKREYFTRHNTKADIIPVVIGGLGAVTKNLSDRLAKIPGYPDQFMCQKICLLGSTRILKDVLKRR